MFIDSVNFVWNKELQPNLNMKCHDFLILTLVMKFEMKYLHTVVAQTLNSQAFNLCNSKVHIYDL